MKRSLFIALAFLFAALGCQGENPQESHEGEPVSVSFQVGVEGATKAIGDGTEALRLTLRVYDANHAFLQAFTADRAANESGWTLNVSVVPGYVYDFCFWASSPESEAYGFDGQYLTVDYSKITPNSDRDDAFWGVQSFKVEGSFTLDVTLQRPLGLVALYSTDDALDLGQEDLNDKDKFVSSLTLKGGVPTRLNLQSGEVDQPQTEVAFPASPLTVLETDQTYGTALSYAYVLVPSGGLTLSEVDYRATLKRATPEEDLAVGTAEDIPLERNRRTLLVTGPDPLGLGSVTITDWASQGAAIEGETAQPGGPFALDAYFPADQLPRKSGWENGDVIFVLCQVAGKNFVSDTYAKYLKMTHNGSAWTVAEMNNGVASPGCLGLAEGDQVTMRAVYLPYDHNVGVGFDGNGRYVFGGGTFECYLTATLSATVSGGRLSGCFDLALPERVMLFTIAHSGGYSLSSLFLREPHLTPLGLKGFTADLDAVNADPVHGAPLYGRPYGNSAADAGYAFCAELDEGLDNVWTDYHFTRDMNFGDFAGYGKRLALSGASGRVLELPALGASDWQALPCAPIDLGFEIDDPVRGGKKRIYWASCNLGATKPEEYGDYFAWGETEPYYSSLAPLTWKDGKGGGYAWGSYFDTTDGGNSFTKYNTAGPTVLEAVDDAATANWGGNWRMPAYEEFITLVQRYGNGWVDNYNDTGISGYTFTGNSATLFLPAAGFRDGTDLSDTGSSCYFWASLLYWGSESYRVKLDDFMPNGDKDYRFKGMSVRPVMD